jgi:hypothetical protein
VTAAALFSATLFARRAAATTSPAVDIWKSSTYAFALSFGNDAIGHASARRFCASA